MEIVTLIIFIIAVLGLILSVLFFPYFSIKGKEISCFYFIPLICAIVMICCSLVPLDKLKDSFLSSNSVNPIRILILFFSMTSLSVYLDQRSFFSYIAEKFSSKFNHSQFLLFYALYFLISVLTIFTSNDIIILTFTPFLIQFCEKNKIKPIPYLVMEFVAANTWSMVFIIGNPTNIYLASAFHLSFFTYLRNMILPAFFTGLVSLLMMTLIFYRDLKMKIQKQEEVAVKLDKVPVVVSLSLLFIATVLLSISQYIGLEMYLVAFLCFLLLFVFSIVYSLIKKQNQVFSLFKALPWNLIPFVLSMFVLVLALESTSFYTNFRDFLLSYPQVLSYGVSSSLVSNLINNIPMSVFYQPLLFTASSKALYATILTSNVSAYLTPLGALAGIMWMRLLNNHHVKMNYLTFLKYSLPIGIPSLLIGLLTLNFITI